MIFVSFVVSKTSKMEENKSTNTNLPRDPNLMDKLYPEDYIRFCEEYTKLSYEEKILLETQQQTRFTRRISNNVLFLFWLTIISYLIGIVIII